MRLVELVDASRQIRRTSSRLRKLELLAGLLRKTPAEEIDLAIAYLSGTSRQGRIGIGAAVVRDARHASASSGPSLTLSDVDHTLAEIAAIRGAGATREKLSRLRTLFSRATFLEQEFLGGLLLGELRQGALEGLMQEAVARAAAIESAALRRAVMVAGALIPVARAVFQEGVAGLDRFRLEPLRPIVPMLAQSAQDVAEALEVLGGEAGFEYKLDGARVQVHKVQEQVRIYTRRLREITPALPEIVARVRALAIRELVADGEVIAIDAGGRPLPFQVTMRRFGRREDVESLRARLPLSVFFFDLLFADGEVLIDEPAEGRLVRLNEAVPPDLRVPHLVTSRIDEAEDFLSRARAAGHEGVMAKSLSAPYMAGRRGSAWLKVKLADTLDLVVLAAEWGSGRRHGWLSNLHLGARDDVNGGFVMLGKTFKGLTDEMLKWQTAKLLELEIAREDYIVRVRPELVVEIAFNDLQISPHYPGRLALRFARVKSYRHDKTARDADTFETVRGIYRRAAGEDVRT